MTQFQVRIEKVIAGDGDEPGIREFLGLCGA